MQVINFSNTNSIINRYMAEMRDAEYQKNRLLFRNNIMRIGELEAYEISKTFEYEPSDVTTPLGIARINLPKDDVILATIFRAGLPFHTGFLNIFSVRKRSCSVCRSQPQLTLYSNSSLCSSSIFTASV